MKRLLLFFILFVSAIYVFAYDDIFAVQSDPNYTSIPQDQNFTKQPLFFCDVSVGSGFSLGNLTNIYRFAPYLNFLIGLPIQQKGSAIYLGLTFSFPVNCQSFEFTDKGTAYKTKATSLIGLNLRYSDRIILNKNLFLDPYLGIGYIGLSTNLVKDTYQDDEGNYQTDYQSADALDLFAGIRLSYKRLSYFIEYHQTTLSNSSKLPNNFGNTFLNMGFAYSFLLY